MNTSSWGPRAWLYLHSVGHNYDKNVRAQKFLHNKKNKQELFKNFFTIIKDTLPCIYCRKSYEGFIKELPIHKFLSPTRENNGLGYWVYEVHNKVNNKLRNQGLLKKGDPSFDQIYNKYSKILAKQDPKQQDNMWYFLHTIAYNFDPEKHNKSAIREFYNLVGETLPYGPKFEEAFKEAIHVFPLEDTCLMSRENLTAWLYLVHEYVNKKLKRKLISYPSTCKKYEKIRANCAPKKGSPGTCKLPDRKNRCSANTSKGRQCSRDQSGGFRYCQQHLR